MSTQRHVFAFLLGLILVFCSGCGGGGGSSKGGGSAASAAAWIDNYTPRACTVISDGENKGVLAPFASLHLEIAPGAHTFVLTCEGQPGETIQADIPRGKTALIRPAAAGDYLILSRSYTAAKPSAVGGDIGRAPAAKTGLLIADYGPLKSFPDTLPGDEATTATRTQIVRALPSNPGPTEFEHFISGDFHVYGIADAKSHRDAVIDQLKRLEPQSTDAAVGDLFIRILDTLVVCATGNNDLVAVSDAILRLLPPHHERIPDDKLIAWLGIDSQTGKARVLPEGHRINPSIATAAVSLLLQRGKQEQVLGLFPVLPEDAARAVVASLAKPPAPEELRRRVVILGLGRREGSVLKEACSAIDKDFVPDEAMVEALTATMDRLDPGRDDDRDTIKYCSSSLVDAFYRHPAAVARTAIRRFLLRFADPQLEPTLENARHALIDGQCAADLVPIYTHFTRDVRMEMVGRLVDNCRKRKAVAQDVIDLHHVALADEDTEVRLAAAKALPQFAAFLTQQNLPAIQDLLVSALSDPSADVQCEAARALEVKGFVPTEQIADQLVADWRLLDETDPQGKASREQLAKSLKTCFEKNPGDDADRTWRERALEALAE